MKMPMLNVMGCLSMMSALCLLAGCHSGYGVGLESKSDQEIRVDAFELILANNMPAPVGHREVLSPGLGTSVHMFETSPPSTIRPIDLMPPPSTCLPVIPDIFEPRLLDVTN